MLCATSVQSWGDKRVRDAGRSPEVFIREQSARPYLPENSCNILVPSVESMWE